MQRANEISVWAPTEGQTQHSRLTNAVSSSGNEIARRPWSVEYKGRANGKACKGKNDTCKGFHTKDSDLCIGCQAREAKAANG